MKDITPLENKLSLINPDDICASVANGASLDNLAKGMNLRFADLFKYITATEEMEKKLTLAMKISEDRDRDLIVRGLRCIIETTPADMFNDDGSLKPVSEWPRELLAGFEVEELISKDTTELVGRVKKVKTVDRLRALELLGKERNMFKVNAKVEHTLTLEELVNQSNMKEAIDVQP